MSRVLITVAGLLAGAPAQAEPVAITNAGFEAGYLGAPVQTGSFPVGPAPTGWTRYDFGGVPAAGALVGVLNPGTQADYDADGGGLMPCFPDGAPEGSNVALLFKSGGGAAAEYGIEQTLTATLQAATRYTLTVAVGNIQTCAGLPPGFRTTFNLDGFPGYRIELRAGNTVLAMDDNGLRPPEGAFETATLSFSAPAAGHAALGAPLSVRLVSLNIPDGGSNLEVDFDDVRLDASAVTAVPLPAGALLPLAAGLAGIARRGRRAG